MQLYNEVLTVFVRGAAAHDLRDCSLPIVQTYLTSLRERVNPTTAHLHFSKLRTFFRWCVETRVLADNPLRGFTMRTPKTLPTVPTDDELRAVLTVCPDTREGVRNRALILVLADSGLRDSEVLHLLVEDWRPADRGLFVRADKGRKDRVSFIEATTTRALKAWLSLDHQ